MIHLAYEMHLATELFGCFKPHPKVNIKEKILTNKMMLIFLLFRRTEDSFIVKITFLKITFEGPFFVMKKGGKDDLTFFITIVQDEKYRYEDDGRKIRRQVKV